MKYEDIIEGVAYKIRDWNDMADEYGLDSYETSITMPGPYFIDNMKSLCGLEVVVTKKLGFDGGIGRVRLERNYGWNFSCHMLEPIDNTSNISLNIDEFIGGILKI